MQKGEIWWANLPIPIGKRPVLLLSRDEAYSVRNAVTIAEETNQGVRSQHLTFLIHMSNVET